MLHTLRVGTERFSSRGRAGHAGKADRWDALAEKAIIVLGYPRSGTTWLAKIFDSHPDVMYRHEPDELTPAHPFLPPDAQIKAWLRQRGLRAAAKRPSFPKSWRSPALDRVRSALGTALTASERVKLTARLSAYIYMPDFVTLQGWRQVRAAIKLVNWDGTLAAESMPATRSVFIVRHPCGQIASVMAGMAAGRFGDLQVDLEAAESLAARRGTSRAGFHALPDPAKFAWSWLAFNEPAVENLGKLRNARILVYEDLCRDPEGISKDLFAFADLDWHPQTSAFLGASTRHDRSAGYFDVFRATELAAERWRQTMDRADQQAVRAVVCGSPLARFWPDFAAPSG
nr:sulfotransferase [uncultured Rhodopila sp.]